MSLGKTDIFVLFEDDRAEFEADKLKKGNEGWAGASFERNVDFSIEHNTVATVVEFLKDDPRAIAYFIENDYSVLRRTAANGALNFLNFLLDIPQVAEGATAQNNHAIRTAYLNGHETVAQRLYELESVKAMVKKDVGIDDTMTKIAKDMETPKIQPKTKGFMPLHDQKKLAVDGKSEEKRGKKTARAEEAKEAKEVKEAAHEHAKKPKKTVAKAKL